MTTPAMCAYLAIQNSRGAPYVAPSKLRIPDTLIAFFNEVKRTVESMDDPKAGWSPRYKEGYLQGASQTVSQIFICAVPHQTDSIESCKRVQQAAQGVLNALNKRLQNRSNPSEECRALEKLKWEISSRYNNQDQIQGPSTRSMGAQRPRFEISDDGSEQEQEPLLGSREPQSVGASPHLRQRQPPTRSTERVPPRPSVPSTSSSGFKAGLVGFLKKVGSVLMWPFRLLARLINWIKG